VAGCEKNRGQAIEQARGKANGDPGLHRSAIFDQHRSNSAVEARLQITEPSLTDGEVCAVRIEIPPRQPCHSFKRRTAGAAELASWACQIYLDPVDPKVDDIFLQPTTGEPSCFNVL
jgi:hypothetical protein